MKPNSRLTRFFLLLFSATALFFVSTSCKNRQPQMTKYGPPSDSYQDQPVTKYGVPMDTLNPVQTKYGVPVPENE